MKPVFMKLAALGLLALGLSATASAALVTEAGLRVSAKLDVFRGTGNSSVRILDDAQVGQVFARTDTLGTLGVWCVDLYHSLGTGSFITAPLTDDNRDQATILSEDTIKKIELVAAFGNAVLYNLTSLGQFSSLTQIDYSPELKSLYSSWWSIVGDAFVDQDNADFSLGTFAAAVQTTIWDLQFGDISATATHQKKLDFSLGMVERFLTDKANDPLEAVRSFELNVTPASGRESESGPEAQDLLASSVPEPGSLSLLGLGLIGLMWGAKVQQRKKTVKA